jgi:hypothetical protein
MRLQREALDHGNQRMCIAQHRQRAIGPAQLAPERLGVCAERRLGQD